MKKLAIIAFTALGIAACGSGRKNAAENAKEAAKDPALQGKGFQGQCEVGATKAFQGLINSLLSGNGLQASPKSYRVEYKFEGARATRKTVSYVQANCEGAELLVQSETGDLKVNPDGKTKDGGQSLNIVFDKLQVTAVGDQGVTFANGVSLCGKTDWQKDKETDQTSKAQDEKCYGSSKLPRTMYSVYKVEDSPEGKVLALNPDTLTEMTAENKRPTDLQGATKFLNRK